MTSKIVPIKAFQDNYIWALCRNHAVWVVDPGEAAPVLEFLGKDKTLEGILITHHHADHVGGVPELLHHFQVPVYGPGFSEPVSEMAGYPFEVIAVPGHTLDHVAYYCPSGILFCGDTLFAAGCGRVFEGTYPQMYASLMKLAVLPDATQVYCAHEYTCNNLRFAAVVEPENQAIQARLAKVKALQENGLSTLPSTIALEKATNPFLRCEAEAVKQAASHYAKKNVVESVDVFEVLRRWKNAF